MSCVCSVCIVCNGFSVRNVCSVRDVCIVCSVVHEMLTSYKLFVELVT